MRWIYYSACFAILLAGVSLKASAQVSNDNEDGVYKVDSQMALDFVPGQVIVKFKDNSIIQVRQTTKGKYHATNINAIDKLLREYNVDVMEKLFPTEMAKPKEQLRKKVAPNGTIVQERNLDKVFLIKLRTDRADSTMMLIERLKNMDDVEYAEPNYLAYITADMPTTFEEMTYPFVNADNPRRVPVSTETDFEVICSNPNQNPLYSYQYGIIQQRIHQLWDKPIINKKRPVIAILDTGVDINHPDLKDNIWTNTSEAEGETAYDDDGNGIVDDKYGWNFVEDYYDLTDHNGHGTHVAGIAAAADNGIGIVGANPLALILPVKVMNDNGIGNHATIARGIVYAADNGAEVLNMSFGTPSLSFTMSDALNRAYQTSILVASAGNGGDNIYGMIGTNYPAAYYLVLGVEASGSDIQRASFSNYDPDGPIYSEDGIDGRNYEVQVPGVDIYSTLPNGKYGKLNGTSMSAPLFAGAVSALQMVKDYPSKDVLIGDLIHLQADFEKIYSDSTPRMPKIDLVSLNVDDNVEGNTNIDGQIDVGETIKFYPVLRNTWADATDINLKLTVDSTYASFVEIDNPEIPFGYSISAYGRQTAKTPITVRFSEIIGDNTRIKFTFEVSYHECTERFTREVYVSVHNMVKINGLITEDRTLTADHIYLVNDNIAIMEGVTLTIEPGTRLEFASDKHINSFGGRIIANGTPLKPIVFTSDKTNKAWRGIFRGDSLSYCILENCNPGYTMDPYPYLVDCLIKPYHANLGGNGISLIGKRNTITGLNKRGGGHSLKRLYFSYSNIVNNISDLYEFSTPGTVEETNNYFNNSWHNHSNNCDYWLGNFSSQPSIISPLGYLGTGREDIVRPYLYEMGNGSDGFGTFDLSNMSTTPNHEAHGIVWKVCVNGKDAQDEYEDLAPLGIGRHKFEVYFNRPMNKEVTPQISFGVREPYTQHVVDEDGSWNEEGTIYTAYKTISGKTMSDGVNRIYVYGAEDNEYFECPYEKTRFNINIQAAGSMAIGFAAEAKMGRVKLTWNNEENNFDDAMGFNIYRYTLDEVGKADTIRINQEIVDIETTEYTDYDVVPGQTYYYLYKVLSTDLKEYDVSNVVAVTPLTSQLGDANGSGDVDVADVITTVNYAAGQEPKPFIFDAADMNADQIIDILDVIGIIQRIINPEGASSSLADATAIYTLENGVLYVDSPVALTGVQVMLNMDSRKDISVAEDLKGFEHTSAWLSDNDYLFLAYNLNGRSLAPGKHALLYIGDADLSGIRLSDASGHNVIPVPGEGTPTLIDMMGSKVIRQSGVFNLRGQKVASKETDMHKLPKGVYIVNGEKVIK